MSFEHGSGRNPITRLTTKSQFGRTSRIRAHFSNLGWFKNFPIFVPNFQKSWFLSRIVRKSRFFQKNAHLNKLYPVFYYLGLNLNMQPFIVLYNQNIPEFYFRIPLYLNIQAFCQIRRRWEILLLPKGRTKSPQSWLSDLKKIRNFFTYLFDQWIHLGRVE